MSSRTFKFSSPGIYTNEIVKTQIAEPPDVLGPVVVGQFEMGPSGRPILINSLEELAQIFGEPNAGVGTEDPWRQGNKEVPTYGAYAAKAFLRSKGPINIVRLLGEESGEADPASSSGTEAGWVIKKTTKGEEKLLSGTTKGGAYGLFIANFDGTTGVHSNGTLAAVFYLTDGIIELKADSTIAGLSDGRENFAGEGAIKPIASHKQRTFILKVPKSATEQKAIEFNFDISSDKFIRKVFNTNPTSTNGTITADDDLEYYWLGETFEDSVVSRLTSAQQIAMLIPLKSKNTTKVAEHADYRMANVAAASPWVVSQDTGEAGSFEFGTTNKKLFRFVSHEGGAWPSRNLKISIRDIRLPRTTFERYATFTVEIRRVFDKDHSPQVIETYTNCNLNPNSENYISKLIGDIYLTWDAELKTFVTNGDYPNVSKHFRVEVSDTVDSSQAAGLAPFGFFGHPRFRGFNIVAGAAEAAIVDGDETGPFNIQDQTLKTFSVAGTSLTTVNIDFGDVAKFLAVKSTVLSPTLPLDGETVVATINGAAQTATFTATLPTNATELAAKLNELLDGVSVTSDGTNLVVENDIIGTSGTLSFAGTSTVATELQSGLAAAGSQTQIANLKEATVDELVSFLDSEFSGGGEFDASKNSTNALRVATVGTGAAADITIAANALTDFLGLTVDASTDATDAGIDAATHPGGPVQKFDSTSALADNNRYLGDKDDTQTDMKTDAVHTLNTEFDIKPAHIINGDFQFKCEFPSMRLRQNTKDVNPTKPENTYWGIDTDMFDTRGAYNESYSDLMWPSPTGVGTETDKSVPDTVLQEYAFKFTLDDIVQDTQSAGATGPKQYTYTVDSRSGGTSFTATNSAEDLLDNGVDRFTMPVIGGFDGLDIQEKDPFGIHILDNDATEANSYAYYTVNRALDSFAEVEDAEIDVIAVPGIVNKNLTDRMIDIAERRADCLAVIDIESAYIPRTDSKDSESNRTKKVSEAVTSIKARNLNSSYACCFYPWVKIRDRVDGSVAWVPPSTVALGVIGRSEATSALWFAPAGFNRGGLSEGASGLDVISARQRLRAKDRDKLYENNINPIATFPAEGLVVLGQKTLQATPSPLDRINVRRLMIHVKREISAISRDILFDQNVRATWQRFLRKAEPFLTNLKIRFGLTDFLIVLDESTTTPDLIDRNIMYAKVFIKPAKAIEFIAVDFVITNTGADFLS